MLHEDAIKMLATASITTTKQQWADLGCGTGTFTLALASLLPPQSTIYAMDTNAAALQQIPTQHHHTTIITTHGDFVNDNLPTTPLNGILLANALHYAKDQPAFIKKAAAYLAPTGCFILVEYDTDISNPWVPYPLSFTKLTKLFNSAGFTSIDKLSERPSLYGRAMIYSVQIKGK